MSDLDTEWAVQSNRRAVGIVGAGPAGLTLGNLLHEAGIPCVVLEKGTREFIGASPCSGHICTARGCRAPARGRAAVFSRGAFYSTTQGIAA
ncbi:FAD-dependent monooxygenase, partial [Saccharothrix sp. MB29]|nr:FAD-dependent monooxygenase [Saccharothrix sp. MB29]